MMCPDPFGDLLKTVIMNDQLACDPDVGGCGKPNHIQHILSSSPHVFTVGKLLSLGYIFTYKTYTYIVQLFIFSA
jgi:hypothetical protein